MAPATEPSPYVPLPGNLALPREAVRTVFETIADLYDSARPGYAPEAIEAISARCGLRDGSLVLEIGCGTGQLTKPLAALGSRVRCLEPGPTLAKIASDNLAEFSTVEVFRTSFEDAVEDPGTFDLVVSATAFHWVDPTVAYVKVASLLRPGGALALLTNVHGAGGSQAEIAAEIQALHRQLAPDIGSWEFPSRSEIEARAHMVGDIAAVWARVERTFEAPPSVGELFDPPFVATYQWIADYDTAGYLKLLATQSSYALMDPARRAVLFARLEELVECRLHGRLTKEYVTVLALARRR